MSQTFDVTEIAEYLPGVTTVSYGGWGVAYITGSEHEGTKLSIIKMDKDTYAITKHPLNGTFYANHDDAHAAAYQAGVIAHYVGAFGWTIAHFPDSALRTLHLASWTRAVQDNATAENIAAFELLDAESVKRGFAPVV